VLLSPIITRLYGPEAFGVMGSFQAMMGIIVPIAALTYPTAIVIPQSNRDAKSLVKLSLIIAFFISLFIFIFVFLFNDFITSLFKLEGVENFLFLIPFVIILAAFMQVTEQWMIRTKQFSVNAKATFSQSLIINGFKVAIGFFQPIALVLVTLSAFSNGIKATLMLIFSKKSKDTSKENVTENVKKIRELAKEYADFPIFRAPQEFINAITNSLPALMLAAYFGPASVGFYSIGRTVLNIPVELIGRAVGDVFYPRIAEATNNKENISLLLKKTTFGLAIIGLIPFSIVIIFGPSLFGFIFGDEWTLAGEYARWIAILAYSSLINRPCVRALPILKAQRFHLMYTIFTLIIRLLALVVGNYVFKSDLTAIMLFGMSGAILNLGLCFITLKITKKK